MMRRCTESASGPSPSAAVRLADDGVYLSRPTEVRPLSVGFVLLHRFTLLPFAAFVDCLRLAADEGIAAASCAATGPS